MINRYFLFILFSTLSAGLFSMEPLLKVAKIDGLCSVHSGILLPKGSPKQLEVKRNMQIVGIHTTDRYKIMLLKTIVDESQLLKQSTREYKHSGLLARVLLTRDEFADLKFYLRLGALAHDKLLATLESYTKKEWRNCRKVSTKYRINNLRSAVLEVGAKKGWMRPQNQEKKRVNL